MFQLNNFIQQITFRSVIIRMLTGWIIGFGIISFFVFGVDHPNPDWGKYWRIRPLIVTPLAGAFGILSFYLKDVVRPGNTLITILIYLFSSIAFIFALWMGIVLGLHGTMWN